MSAWRVVVKEIQRHGPMHGTVLLSRELHEAHVLKLIAHDDRKRWALTPLGRDWCEGRVATVQVRPGGRRFVATWLRALPQGLSMA